MSETLGVSTITISIIEIYKTHWFENKRSENLRLARKNILFKNTAIISTSENDWILWQNHDR